MRTRLMFPAAALAAALLACGGGEETGDEAGTDEPVATERTALSVYAVNYPLAYFAERVGGDGVEVHLPVPAGVDPAYWRPSAEEIGAFQTADLVLLNGAGYAGWVETSALPRSRLVNTTARVEDRFVAADATMVHAHGPEGEHEHGVLAFTTWLDPTLALEQARAIRNAFVDARPDDEAAFDAGLEALQRDLLELDSLQAAAFDRFGEQPMLGSHPVYQYLAEGYGLDLRSVHFEPDELPGAAAWDELRELQRERPAALMLWEAEPLPEVRERLSREFGIASVRFDPCANWPDADDYMVVMRDNARRLSAIADRLPATATRP